MTVYITTVASSQTKRFIDGLWFTFVMCMSPAMKAAVYTCIGQRK